MKISEVDLNSLDFWRNISDCVQFATSVEWNTGCDKYNRNLLIIDFFNEDDDNWWRRMVIFERGNYILKRRGEIIEAGFAFQIPDEIIF